MPAFGLAYLFREDELFTIYYQNVLNTGLETDEFFEVQEMDFDGLLNKIEKYY